MKATLKFRLKADASDWYVTKEFADKRHMDNYIKLVCRARECFLDEAWNTYPFSEGDDYYVIENNEVVWSGWDEISEEFYNQDPDTPLFKTREEAEEFINKGKPKTL